VLLWEAGVELARERFGHVLSCRGVEAEGSLSFAALSDLIAPSLDGVAAFLLPLRRGALEVALLRAEPGEQPPDPRAIGLALLDVLRLLAEQGPSSSPSTTCSGSTPPRRRCSGSRCAA
jgi:hypothetical protein